MSRKALLFSQKKIKNLRKSPSSSFFIFRSTRMMDVEGEEGVLARMEWILILLGLTAYACETMHRPWM